MRTRLTAAAAPVIDQIREHPFWDGLRRGTLPPESLWYFAEQDAHHVVPAYARALARCAAATPDDAHGALLAGAAGATFGSLDRVHRELDALAGTFEVRPRPLGPTPDVHAYTAFMLAAPAVCPVEGMGALLPMTWFHFLVGEDLRTRSTRGSRYAAWIAQYLPDPDFYPAYLESFLGMVEDTAARTTPAGRDRLEAAFRQAARGELAFADAAWSLRRWPL